MEDNRSDTERQRQIERFQSDLANLEVNETYLSRAQRRVNAKKSELRPKEPTGRFQKRRKRYV